MANKIGGFKNRALKQLARLLSVTNSTSTLGVFRGARQGASTEQRAALREITYGRAGGAGCFPIFSQTMRYILDPQFVPMQLRIDGQRSSFAVPGVLEVQLAPHIDPVSGDEQDVQVALPKGFIWQLASAVKTAVMKITTPNLNFDHSSRNAFWTTVEFHGP